MRFFLNRWPGYVLLRVVLLGGMWLNLPACRALEYELQGMARDEPRALDLRFQVCVRDCQWRISCWHAARPGVRFEAALLASNEVIRVMDFADQEWATAVIEADQLPRGCEESATSLLWLILASGCWWSSSGTGAIPPVYDRLASAAMDPSRKQTAYWELMELAPFLPRRVAFLHGGRYRLWDSRTGQAKEIPLAPPYGRGFTNAVVTVSDQMKLQGMLFPKAFRFEEFGPARTNGGLSLKRRLTGFVELARPSCAHPELTPRPPYRTAVRDRRLLAATRSEPVTYSVASGNWPDVRELRRIQQRQRRRGLPSVWQVVLFCLLALAPLTAVIWRRRAPS